MRNDNITNAVAMLLVALFSLVYSYFIARKGIKEELAVTANKIFIVISIIACFLNICMIYSLIK